MLMKLRWVPLAMAIAWPVATTWGASPAQEPPAPRSPAESLKALRPAKGLSISLVLAEPEIAQPVSFHFDERGRLWVVEYRQYPDPAGLVELSRDKFWRAIYDKVPAPPPHHVRGEDRITIHEDADGDGTYEIHKTFVDGLNIATACACGRGGVWVLNPPYLLFYPDLDGDDVPDGDPEVRLSGFGLEDTHSVVNSLRWGPDGWLYGAQGSTVGADVIGPGLDETPVHTMGQLIWRYHPEAHRFEVFAEGGGNAFGVEIDDAGRIFSGHNGGDTRGFHYVQGGYYLKGFQKHGPLSNPYAFGFFSAMRHPPVERFTHTFVIYSDDLLPEPYRDRLFGVEPLQGRVVFAEIRPDGSSFQTRDLGYALTSDDPWFRPVDIKVGPDGALYVADFYEAQIGHLRHHEGAIDPSNGRIYRIGAEGETERPRRAPDLGRMSTDELVAVLGHGNRWARQTALRLLGDRKDPKIVPTLRAMIRESRGTIALEALWALNLSGGLDEASALASLKHEDPLVRAWTIRLLADDGSVSPTVADILFVLARDEPSVEVRSQLASSARRLPAEQGLPIVAQLLGHDEDLGDVHVPLLLWWAIEARCERDREAVLALFRDPDLWTRPIVEREILSRLMQRFASTGRLEDYQACVELLRLAPGQPRRDRLIEGFELAARGRSLATLPEALATALAESGGGSLLLDLRRGRPGAIDEALAVVADPDADPRRRLALVEALGETERPQSVPVLLGIVERSPDDALRTAALYALIASDDPAIPKAVLPRFGAMAEDEQAAALTLLASRKGSAMALVEAVDRGTIPPGAVSPEVLRTLTIHGDDRIAALVAKHWGAIQGAPTADLRREIERLGRVAGDGTGDRSHGKALFTERCGKCHELFGEGGQVGPDLTSYRRNDLPNLLLHVIDPDAEIREGFETVQVATEDGRVLAGSLRESDPQLLILRGPDGRDVSVRRDEVEEMQAVPRSLMPEGLLNDLDDQAVRDLLAYLRSSQPLNE